MIIFNNAIEWKKINIEVVVYFQSALKKMREILERIAEMASEQGIPISSLERQIGASKGVLSRAINNKRTINIKWIPEIVDIFHQRGYNPTWISTGIGDKKLHTNNAIKESAVEYNVKNSNNNNKLTLTYKAEKGRDIITTELYYKSKIEDLKATIDEQKDQIRHYRKQIDSLQTQIERLLSLIEIINKPVSYEVTEMHEADKEQDAHKDHSKKTANR